MLFHLVFALGLSSLALCAIHGSIDDIPKLDWDFIIAGGGTAGSVLASRLAENPRFNVLLIEAGPTNEGALDSIVPGLEHNTFRSRFDWNFTTTPQEGLNGRTITLQRGHILGGSSSVNAMIYTRGSSSDYDRFARISGDPGWSWERVQPYFKKHEKLEAPADNHDTRGQFNPAVHSRDGMVPVTLPGFSRNPAVDAATLQASRELGGDFKFNLDMNSGTPLGLGWLQSTIGHDGTRSSAATSYLNARIQARENLHIVTDTRVTRVLATTGRSIKGLTIRTVEIRASQDSQQTLRLTASKEVIIAAGTYGTPHILLNSGIGDQNDLEVLDIPTVLHNPSVGKNLSDHPVANAGFALTPNSIDLGPWANLSFDPTLQARALELWKANGTGPDVMLVTTNHIAWTRLPDDSPIFKTFPDPSSGQNSAHMEFLVGMTGGVYSAGFVLVSPASRGTVTLRSNNPFDDPLIDPRYFTSEFDMFATREALRTAMRFARAPVWQGIISGVLGPLANATSDAELDAIIKNSGATALHPVGTASMSPKGANWGVVDPDLLVKRVTGLRIVDASVMPYVPCAHTQTAVYIIAERAADMIKAAWN